MQKATLGPVLLFVQFLATAPAQSEVYDYHDLELAAGGVLSYAVALPENFDPRRPYPLLLALPPGQQDRDMVAASMRRYWGRQATSRGWIVVSPVAPEGKLFFRGGELALPALMRKLRIDFKIEGNRFHLAGSSNGGRSAFRLATRFPYQFQTLTVLPGYPPEAEDAARLPRLRGISVHMFAGGDDRHWVAETEKTVAALRALDIDVHSEVFPGEGHVPPSLDGTVIMDLLVSLQAANRQLTGPMAAADALLDDFHDAASKADEDRYFGHFTPKALFFGTAPEERWNISQFRSYAEASFARDSAWIYVPQTRQIDLAPGNDFAWFDEVLVNARYGECRGTGVLRKRDGRWQVAQYNLSVPVPNELMGKVVEMIQAGAATQVQKR